MNTGPVSRTIASRRSLRRFDPASVDQATVRGLVALACAAPAPHHSRPWRFVHVASAGARERLADSMADSWRADLERDGRSVHDVSRLLVQSQRQITEAPALLVACLTLTEARPWPDEPRRLAERDMFVQSLGAALQNILLAAAERGLSGFLKGAPLFCQPAVRAALDLPPEWQPAFLVILGHPQAGGTPAQRPTPDLTGFLLER